MRDPRMLEEMEDIENFFSLYEVKLAEKDGSLKSPLECFKEDANNLNKIETCEVEIIVNAIEESDFDGF